MKADAVFEGGGVKGIAFVGAVCCLEEKGYEWERLAGTSAGSIVAALLAAGYTGKEMKEIISNLDYKKFMDHNKVQAVPAIGEPLSLLTSKGLHMGKFIEQWIGELLQKKGKTKFKDISVNGVSKLKIIASDITKKDIMILPDDLRKYDIDPMNFEIAKAVRMSTSIPFYFKPIKLRYKNGESLIVDGGLLSNFPIWIFDVKGRPRWPTLGFKLMDNVKSNSSSGKTDVVSYLLDIINTVVNRNEEIYLSDKNAVRTMSIPTLGVGTTEFDLTKEKSEGLYNEGYRSAQKFIESWDFSNYVRQYRA